LFGGAARVRSAKFFGTSTMMSNSNGGHGCAVYEGMACQSGMSDSLQLCGAPAIRSERTRRACVSDLGD